jgi:hypothetical protein
MKRKEPDFKRRTLTLSAPIFHPPLRNRMKTFLNAKVPSHIMALPIVIQGTPAIIPA